MNRFLSKSFSSFSFHRFHKLKHYRLNQIPIVSLSSNFSTVKIRFYEEAMDNLVEVDAEIGKRVLDIALENDIDIEGACGGELACSTCHVIVPEDIYNKLPPKKEEEQDMLDLAWGATDLLVFNFSIFKFHFYFFMCSSRLCCQIIVTPELAGAQFKVPKDTNNMLG